MCTVDLKKKNFFCWAAVEETKRCLDSDSREILVYPQLGLMNSVDYSRVIIALEIHHTQNNWRTKVLRIQHSSRAEKSVFKKNTEIRGFNELDHTFEIYKFEVHTSDHIKRWTMYQSHCSPI